LCSCCVEFLRTQVDVEDESPSAVKEKAVLYETTPALAREQVCLSAKPNQTVPGHLRVRPAPVRLVCTVK
jgi:hypothetical protein